LKFTSLFYAIFLVGSLTVYWGIAKTQQQRLATIVAVSFLFYALSQIKNLSFAVLALHVGLLAAIVGVNFYIGKILLESQIIEFRSIRDNLATEFAEKRLPRNRQEKKRLLAFGIVFNLVILATAKYIPFTLTNISSIVNSIDIQNTATWYKENIFPPLGISFLTFESIAYLVDVYKGQVATGNLLKYAAYKGFFPKLISGPIVHYQDFARQLNEIKLPTAETIAMGCWWIAKGAIKKAAIADNLGGFVNLVFGSDNLERAGSIDLWLALIAYGWQLYFDFSGYVDIVRGTALFFGFQLPENFYFPYLSTNIADFWRRWHSTLGDWLKNYIYIPLGGSRYGWIATCRNLFIIMLVSGLWHGAEWGYLLWGILHGFALVIHRLYRQLREKYPRWNTICQQPIMTIVGWICTQFFVFIAWLFFRLPQPQKAFLAWQHLWNHPPDIQFADKVYIRTLGMNPDRIAFILAAIAIAHVGAYTVHRWWRIEPHWAIRLSLVPILLYLVSLIAPEKDLPYIYFDF
jgi:alginate O-acetyltransferase complex protein AlgI